MRALLLSLMVFSTPALQANAAGAAETGDLPPSLPEVRWRLTPKPWQPSGLTREAFLEPLQRAARAVVKLQDERGAIVDPYVKREFQYATPYFAHAIGQLLQAGAAEDLRAAGVAAMEHATRCFAGGLKHIPDRHGEFYIAALTEALELYRGQVDDEQWQRWRQRVRTPLWIVLAGYDEHLNNWRTYAMRGEWLRARHRLADKAETVEFIENSWKDFQRKRLTDSWWNLYLDHSSLPNSQAVEAVGRGNLLGLVAAGYDGPSADEMGRLLDRATRTSLLLQDPTGQAPPNGRTDNHVWNDILYGLCFEMAAERALAAGDKRLAGQYRRAASLAHGSALRWQREDGSFSITKNFFDNAMRVGYQPASQWTNYNGAVLFHLAEAYGVRRSPIEEQPSPVEIGGYALQNDPQFASAFINAGGLQVMVNLQGETDPAKYNMYWTTLGIARIARAGWDSRLGPIDGVRDTFSRQGVSFGPTWKEEGYRASGRWTRLASVPQRYRGEFRAELATPALARCTVRYAPVEGSDGPVFTLRLTLTPDGMLARMESEGIESHRVGWTLPLLQDDGRGRLQMHVGGGIASTAYREDGDQQVYLVAGDAHLDASPDAVLGSPGWLRPVRAEADTVFVYPRKPGEPAAAKMLAGLQVDASGFRTPLVHVEGEIAIGNEYAGGRGRSVDLDGDGRAEIEFDRVTQFTARLHEDRIVALETDRDVTAHVQGRSVRLTAHRPVAPSD